jgi:hypothetical protein
MDNLSNESCCAEALRQIYALRDEVWDGNLVGKMLNIARKVLEENAQPEYMNEQSPSNAIHVESGVSVFTGKPFIAFHWGENHGQLTVAEANAYAFALLEACEAAESDAFIFEFMRKQMGATAENAVRMVMAFREYRDGRQPPPEIPEREQ